MAKKMKIEFRPISVGLIDIGPEQSRTSKKYLQEGIDDLAEKSLFFSKVFEVGELA